MNTLRARLGLAMVVLTVLPLSIYLLANLVTTRRALQIATVDHLAGTANLRKAAFERWSQGHQVALRLQASNPSLYDDVSLLADDQAGIAVAVAARARLVNQHLEPTQSLAGFGRVFVVDAADGQVIASTDADQLGQLQPDQPYVVEGLTRSTLQAPHISVFDGTLVMTAATPIVDDRGRTLGVLAGEFSLADGLSPLMVGGIGYQTEESYLVNSAGLALTELRFIEDAVLDARIDTPGVQYCLTGNPARGWFRDYRGVPVLGAYEYLPTHGLCLAVEVDEAEALAPMIDLSRGQLAVFLLTSFLSVSTGFALASRITGPIDDMRERAAGLAAGDLSIRMPEVSTEELSRLGQTFNLMAAELQGNIGRLEAEVDKRTAELARSEFELRVLLESSEALASGGDLEASLRQVLELLCSRGDWVYAEAWLVDETGAKLNRTAFSHGQSPAAAVFAAESAGLVFVKGQGLVGKVWQAGAPEWVQDISTHRRPSFSRIGEARRAGLHAVLAVPAMVGPEVLAVLVFFSDVEHAEDGGTARLTLAVARQLGPAIQRRQAIEALELSEARYLALFHEMPIGLYRTTADGHFLDANQAMVSLLGYPDRNTLISSPIDLQYVDANDRLRWIESLRQHGVVSDFEAKVSRYDGQPMWVRQTTRLRRGSNGDGEILEGAVVDISPRKKAEEALQAYTTELARSNRELEHFAYVASHDLQEPLRMVSSYVQLLEQRYADKLDDDAREFINYAVDGADRMKRLINDLLAYSRVGTRGQELQPVDTQAIVARSLQSLRPALEACSGRVEVGTLPEAMADEGQLEQVFTNLISNGIKFRGKSDPLIQVNGLVQGREAVFSVADNGIGIDPQYFDRIFILFQRLHTRQAYEGTGIGLAICKKIVERHRGRIWLESNLGQGTKVFFSLPAVEESD